MLTVGGTKSILARIRSVVGLGSEQRLVVSFLKLDGVGPGESGGLDHLFRCLHITLVVSADLGDDVGRGVVGDGGGPHGEGAGGGRGRLSHRQNLSVNEVLGFVTKKLRNL